MAEDDAVLVVVDIGGVLQEPGLPAQLQGDEPVVAPGGLVGAAQVALVLPAEGALGVAGLGGVFGGGNGLGVLLRLGEVDGDDQIPVRGGGGPHPVLLNPVHPDVVGRAGQLVVVVGGGLLVLFVEAVELPHHLGGAGHQAVHQLGVKLVPAVPGVGVDKARLGGELAQALQGLHRGVELLLHRLGLKLPQAQQGQHPVGGIGLVLWGDEPPLQPIFQQPADFHVGIRLFHTATPFLRWSRILLYYKSWQDTIRFGQSAGAICKFLPPKTPGGISARGLG